MVDEFPFDSKSLGQMRAEGLHAEGFRRVMAAEEEIDAQFLREGMAPMGAFARDEGVDPLADGGCDFRSGASRADPHDADGHGAAGGEMHRSAEGGFESGGDFTSREMICRKFQTDGNALEREERFAVLQTQCLGEPGIVSHGGMGIQRVVDADQRQVVFKGELEFAVVRARDGLNSLPEQAVMDEQEIGFSLHGLVQDREMAIDGGCDLPDGSGVLDLEPVVSEWEIGDLSDGEEVAEIGVDLVKAGHDGRLGIGNASPG